MVVCELANTAGGSHNSGPGLAFYKNDFFAKRPDRFTGSMNDCCVRTSPTLTSKLSRKVKHKKKKRNRRKYRFPPSQQDNPYNRNCNPCVTTFEMGP